jgi:molybdopterin converting factor small subunit
MPLVQVTIPRMLAELIGGNRHQDVEAATVRGALETAISRHPELAVHVFDETGEIRPHVSVFHNERSAQLHAELNDGDAVVVLQAVSGG